MAPSKSRIKVAVIGAGAAGLCAAKHLLAEPIKFTINVFEQQDGVGGTWRYSPQVGEDDFGLPVHSSMYKNLRTNLPKEIMAFPNFPFPSCEGKSFVHHTDVLHYLEEYAKHFELYQHIKFHTFVQDVRTLTLEGGRVEWSVSYCDLVTKEKETHIYDAVMVCNGHYSVPFIPPNLEGLKDFKGVVMHSHDYREPDPFRNLKVVVLGAGASGSDIAAELSQVVNEVIMSHNQPPRQWPLPENFKQESGIKSVGETSVTFHDGKVYECDAIVLATGYLYHYPFLDPSCQIEIVDHRVSPLFMHLFNIKFPSMAIWAIPKLILPFPIYDQQVKVFLKFLKGAIQLPDKEEMQAHMEREFAAKLATGGRPKDAHVLQGELQWQYDKAISQLGKINPLPEVTRKLFLHVHKKRVSDLLAYKNANFNLVDHQTFEEVE